MLNKFADEDVITNIPSLNLILQTFYTTVYIGKKYADSCVVYEKIVFFMP